MSILSSFYQKMFGPAQPISTFHTTERYKHYFGSNEFKLLNTNPIPDWVLGALTQPKELKALIPRKVGLWKTTETIKYFAQPIKYFAQPITIPAGWVGSAIQTVATAVDNYVEQVTGNEYLNLETFEVDTDGYRPIAATTGAVSWLGNTAYKTAVAAGKAWNNYAPNEWAFDGSWMKPLVPNFLSWSPAGDEALAKKIEMHEVLETNCDYRDIHLRTKIKAKTLYSDEVALLSKLSQGDIEGYNRHLRKVYGDERIGLLFRRAQAHLLRMSRFEVRNDYATQVGIKDKSKMKGFQDNFNLQLKHLPKAIESASAAIDELLKAFSGRESEFLNEIESLKEKLAQEEAQIPALDKLVERLLSIPEVTESSSLHQAVLALPTKVNNPEQLYLAIQALNKVMVCLKKQKSEDNAEKIDQTEADLSNLEQFWPIYNHLKEALSAYEEIAKVGKDLRNARKELLGNPEEFKDTFEKHPKTLFALVRAFETLKEVENLPAEMKNFAEYFVSTLKESIHIRAVAATELARILHYGLEVDPMHIPGLYTDLQSRPGADGLSAMPIATVFKPQEFSDVAEKGLRKLEVAFEEGLLAVLEEIGENHQGQYKEYWESYEAVETLLKDLKKLKGRSPTQAEFLNLTKELRHRLVDLKEAFTNSELTTDIAADAAHLSAHPRIIHSHQQDTVPRHNLVRGGSISIPTWLNEELNKVNAAFGDALNNIDSLIDYGTHVYEDSEAKRARIGKMLKEMKETAKKELADCPYKTPEEFLFRAGLDFRFLDLFLDQGSKEKDKRLKDVKKFFESMSPAWTVDVDPEDAVEKHVEEDLSAKFQDFLKEIVPGIKVSDTLAAGMTALKSSVKLQLKNALELLENSCASEKGMNLIVACLDEKNPKRHHAFGNLFFRGVGIGQYAGDSAGKNESSLSRYRQALDFYAKAVNEALEYRVGFDEKALVTGDDVNTFRHAAKKAGYFLQSAEAMVRFENLLKNAQDFLSTEGPTKPDRETWTLFVDKLLRRLNAAIAAEEKMTGIVIAEHWLFQDYAQGGVARSEDGTIAPQDGLDAKASAHLARVLARKGVFGVLDPEVEEMVKNIPPKPQTRPGDVGQSTFGMDAALTDPRGGYGGGDPKRDYAQENRSAHVEYLRPAVRMAGHAKNPSNLVDLYRWKAMLLDAVRRPEDADNARRNALQRKEEGIIDKKDFFFDEKKFQQLYQQFGGIEEKEQQTL